MGWSYSDMSHEAKLNGGPEKWIETITSNAEINGEKKMMPIMLATSSICLGLGVLGTNLYHWFKKDKVSNKEAKIAKENLINELSNNEKNIKKNAENTEDKVKYNDES